MTYVKSRLPFKISGLEVRSLPGRMALWSRGSRPRVSITPDSRRVTDFSNEKVRLEMLTTDGSTSGPLDLNEVSNRQLKQAALQLNSQRLRAVGQH